jgi:DNA helicase-2/ATP-dependent DNA helicase PcrA
VSYILSQLNPEQQKAVKIRKGPILVLAGAGSGKTRVITYRIAYLIEKGYAQPHNILAITFTNKAADEMRTRIFKLLNGSHNMWIRTFHSTCAKILRDSLFHRKQLKDLLGVSGNFSIYDEHDQTSLIKECLKDLDIDARDFPPSLVGGAIERIKQNLQRLDTADDELILTIYKYYNKKLREYNALDFDDLIMKAVELFENDEDTLAYYQDRFRYIMVDEYQDTNLAQYMLTKLLAEKYRNLCVVGDDDQSIYSWRGAEIRNILNFERDFPDTVVIKLEQNYRSTKTILKAASSVVKNNEYRKPKILWCDNEDGEKVEFFAAPDAYTEAAYVARKIIEAKMRGIDLDKIAVFYRINYQSRVFEECFVKYQIPYEVVGSLKFYERAEIKNVLAYLRVINNRKDSVSLRRIINIPSRKIGYITVDKLSKYAEEHKISLFDTLQKLDAIESIDKGTKRRLKDFRDLLKKWIGLSGKMNLHGFSLQIVKESGYLDSLEREKTERDFIRRKNVEELLISIKDYAKQYPDATLQDYLSDVSLRSEIDEWDESAKRISLMTLHNAKGLEFDHVFITGLEDGLIPHYKSQSEEHQYEEERRLLYVGITRARKKLFLTYAQQRDVLRGGSMYTALSPFFREIPGNVFAATVESDHAF